MKVFVVVFATLLAVVHGGVIAHSGVIAETVVAPAVKSSVVQGPSSTTHVVGSDGSQIVAHAPGAAIHSTEQLGITSEVISPAVSSVVGAPVVSHAAHVATPIVAAAPVVARTAAVVAPAVPVVANSAPIVAHAAAPVVAHATAPVVAHAAAPVVAHVASPVVAHATAPVVTHASAPVITHAAAPVVAHAAVPVVAKTLIASPLTASGYPVLAPGSGIEGQWIPDINEKLHDDGLYKGEIY